MRRHLTHAVKVTVVYALYYTGAFRLWQLVAMRNRAVVLMYHRVLSEDEQRRTGSHPGIVVTRDTFARHMALVKERFLVLTAEQLGDHLAERRPLPPAACVITFDDGWRDNLTGAVPVLRRLNLPAVIFLPVNFIGERRLFWRESLTHLLVDAVRTVRTNTSCRAQLARALESSGLDHLLGVTDGDPRSAVIDAIARSPRLTEASAHCLMQSIESILKRPLDLTSTPDSFVTWDEVRDMAAAGITFGGHGVDHRRLGELPLNEADQEDPRLDARRLDTLGRTGPVVQLSTWIVYFRGPRDGEGVRISVCVHDASRLRERKRRSLHDQTREYSRRHDRLGADVHGAGAWPLLIALESSIASC